jgi:hypothetical protein
MLAAAYFFFYFAADVDRAFDLGKRERADG